MLTNVLLHVHMFHSFHLCFNFYVFLENLKTNIQCDFEDPNSQNCLPYCQDGPKMFKLGEGDTPIARASDIISVGYDHTTGLGKQLIHAPVNVMPGRWDPARKKPLG